MRLIIYVLIVIPFVQVAYAEAVRGSLFLSTPLTTRATASGTFIGRAEGGLFAERPVHTPAFAQDIPRHLRGSDIDLIRDLIQEAESRRDGYDAVQHGARIKPEKPPTEMTLAEIFAWIDATPNQPHAIGRYQFIPKTLRRVVDKIGAKPSQNFTPALQDELADVLLVEAGLNRFRAGALDRTGFMNNLAKIWAGLPNSSGKSHYDGYAGNKASVTWARFDAVMTRISPQL
ncbi:hypothetical protein [uncultured Sulfitobacter sp.]|uniref:hypothetical protein n=1 Tax=uncultured Sulfitobacter sp. TaxID=191468 RepID=UPI002616FDC5|nr:hypothetical protein [uncultured Sulfitobacter sp.]